MSPEPTYLRFENTSPPHYNSIMRSRLPLFYPKWLTRRWDRIGARRPRSIRMVIYDPDELVHQVELISKLRQRHGYQTVTEVRSPIIEACAE